MNYTDFRELLNDIYDKELHTDALDGMFLQHFHDESNTSVYTLYSLHNYTSMDRPSGEMTIKTELYTSDGQAINAYYMSIKTLLLNKFHILTEPQFRLLLL
jgi:hypothetical protein